MNDFENYTFDDDEFAEGANINKITEAYNKVLENLKTEVENGISISKSGSSKELFNVFNRIYLKVSAIMELSNLDNRIVGPSGQVFNTFGQANSDDDEENEEISEKEFIEKINKIIDGCSTIQLSDAERHLNKNNIIDDGLSHGDLDGTEW